MRISAVHIKNFRCLEDVKVEFDDVTTFIGPNGVGKSTVLHALDWFFNAPQGSLLESDCTSGSGIPDISVEVEFTDLTPEDREGLGHYAPAGVSTFRAWRTRDDSGKDRMSANAKAYAPFSDIRLAGGKTEVKNAYKTFRDEHADFGLASAASADTALEEMVRWESENQDKLEDAPTELTTNFFGFNSQGKMSGLFDFVLVTADLRAHEQVADQKATIIGRILERAVDRTAADAEIATLAEEVLEKQRQIYDTNFRTQLESLSNDLTASIAQYTQGHEIKIKNDDLDIKPPRTQFSVDVADNGITTTVQRQGHGFQRTLLISALQLLAKRGAAGTSDGTICLAIEEPELFQHPVQAQAFATVLRRLAQDASQRIQVAYATHSPYFISAGNFHQVRRLSRGIPTPGLTPKVEASRTSVSELKTALSGKVTGTAIDNQLDSVALNRLPDALFARAVVLVEGTSDRAIIEGLCERPGQDPLAVSGIVVAEVGSKSSILLPKMILEKLGIPTYVVFDGDKGCEAAMRTNGRDEADIQAAVDNHTKTNKALLESQGIQPVEWPTTSVNAKYAVWEDTLEPMLDTEWQEWKQEVDSIKASGTGNPKKNAMLYRDASRLASGTVPALLESLIVAIRAI